MLAGRRKELPMTNKLLTSIKAAARMGVSQPTEAAMSAMAL